MRTQRDFFVNGKQAPPSLSSYPPPSIISKRATHSPPQKSSIGMASCQLRAKNALKLHVSKNLFHHCITPPDRSFSQHKSF
ncbi:unknown protein [Desulfotalea psychrophila LSv54]|uniref:Uncharacterized protein n=1 Tax=Desulfotalea psychrophila (strain LSv54 / DSM 12343) TaxID=177439 RepID=Q6ASD6_DESPS|nr:unknown protein [Desulfotalea psychrophila LSv54]